MVERSIADWLTDTFGFSYVPFVHLCGEPSAVQAGMDTVILWDRVFNVVEASILLLEFHVTDELEEFTNDFWPRWTMPDE